VKKFWSQLKPQERRWVAGIGFVVFIILNYLLVWPQFGKWNQNVARMERASTKLVDYRLEVAKRAEYDRQIKMLESDGPPVQAEDQALHFETFYNDRAAESGMSIQTRSPLTSRTNDSFFVEKQATIQVLTTEKGLVEFLYVLGSSNSLMRVQNMSLRPVEPNRYQLSASLTIVASYKKNTPTPPPAVAPKPAAAPAPATTNKPNPAPPTVKQLTNTMTGPGRISPPGTRAPTPTTTTNKPGPRMTKNL
jgi:hypothetical protein